MLASRLVPSVQWNPLPGNVSSQSSLHDSSGTPPCAFCRYSCARHETAFPATKPWPGIDGTPTIKVLGIRGQIDNGSFLPEIGSCIYQYALSRVARISTVFSRIFDNMHFSDAGEAPQNFYPEFSRPAGNKRGGAPPIKAGADTGRACPMQTYGQRSDLGKGTNTKFSPRIIISNPRPMTALCKSKLFPSSGNNQSWGSIKIAAVSPTHSVLASNQSFSKPSISTFTRKSWANSPSSATSAGMVCTRM